MRQTTSMKPIGIALLFLAAFSICTANEQEQSSDQSATSSSPLSTAISDNSTITLSSITDSSVTSNDASEQVSVTISSELVEVTVSPWSTAAASEKSISTEATESPPRSSVTAQPNSTWTKAGLDTSKMTSESINSQKTTSTNDGSSPAPVTRMSPIGTHTQKTTSLPKSLLTTRSKSLHSEALRTTSTVGGVVDSSVSKDKQTENDHYSSIILPVVITLIVITLSVFILVALCRMCRRTTPERQENGNEQAPTDKEGVKLLSVKTASPETVFVAAHDLCAVGFSLPSANLYEINSYSTWRGGSQVKITGENSSLGRNKTCQHDESSSHPGNKYM